MKCEFCGRELKTMMVPALRHGIPLPCDCTGAVRQREEMDRMEWERNRSEVLQAAIRNANLPSALNLYPKWGDGTPCYLYGEQGRGKSEMACGALRKFLADGIVEIDRNRFFSTRSAKFYTSPELMMRIRKTYDSGVQSESDLIDSLAGVGMLCIDDFGKGQLNRWVLEKIELILNMRDRDGKMTFFTSQYDLDEIARMFTAASDAKVASAIRSRIDGSCKVLRIGGQDWRLRRVRNS